MSLYPCRQDIRSTDNDPAINPTQFIGHVAVVPIRPGITSGPPYHDHLDWHFFVDAGPGPPEEIVTQLRDTHRQADANFKANGPRADGSGALSFESEGSGDDPWTDDQVEAIIWLFQKGNEIDGIPLLLCPAWDAPGVGYHRLFNEWNNPYHSCPGDQKVEQFRFIILPRLLVPKQPTITQEKAMGAAGKTDGGVYLTYAVREQTGEIWETRFDSAGWNSPLPVPNGDTTALAPNGLSGFVSGNRVDLFAIGHDFTQWHGRREDVTNPQSHWIWEVLVGDYR